MDNYVVLTGIMKADYDKWKLKIQQSSQILGIGPVSLLNKSYTHGLIREE